MPKEITHLAVAQKLRQAFARDSLFHDAIERFSNLFLYGAIAPDTCFYYLFGPHSDRVQTLSRPFHVSNSDALKPVLNFLNSSAGMCPEALAFSAGICCHLMTDTNFHPLVYFFAGSDELHDGATIRHRIFETAMDVHFAAVFKDKNTPGPDQVMSHLEVPTDRTAELLEKILCAAGEPCSRYLPNAFRYHCFACSLFSNHGLYRLSRALRRVRLGMPEKFESLFYPFRRPVRLKFFDQALEYRDPETGNVLRKKVESLAEKAVKETRKLLFILESDMTRTGTTENILTNKDLPQIRPCPPLEEKSFLYWYGSDKLKEIVYGDEDL